MAHFKHIITVIILSLLGGATLQAQQSDDILNEIQIFQKFGNINDSDLGIENSSASGYPYEYLLKETSIRFDQRNGGVVALIDHLIRIKVYTDEPVLKTEASLVGIPFYFAENMERIVNLEGQTHQPDGSLHYFSSEQARFVDLNSRYKLLEFEMPEVQQGSVIEYKYTLERRYIEELPDFHFSHRVPVREANLYLKNEDYLRFDTVKENINFDLEYREARVDTSSIPFVFTYERPDPVYVQVWNAENIPAIDATAFISSIDDIRGKLKFQISEFGLPRQPLENSWEFVAAQIQRNANPYRTLERHPELQELGKTLFGEIQDPVARQDSVFKYVNSKVQFNEMSAVFIEGSLDHVLEGEPADQAQINMVLLAMLRGANMDAKPLYISGRDFGRINKSFPSLYQFNRMLVVSEIEGDRWFMDASFSHSLPNLIPVDTFNEQGMILSEKLYNWVEITPDRSVFHLDISVDAELTANGDLIGAMRAETRGYPSREIRRDIHRGIPMDEIIKKTFFEVYPDSEVRESSINISETDRDRIEVTADFSIPGYAVTFSEGLEFRPMIVGYLFNNPFELTERRAPITLDAPEILTISYSITLPEGFETEVAGDTRSTSLRGAGLFEEYLTEGSLIEYSFGVEISRKEFPADLYSQLRQIYERWVSLSNDVWYIEKN
jgi:hypothetical protein